jgi:hypothetical protein
MKNVKCKSQNDGSASIMMFRRILIAVAVAFPLLAGAGCSSDTKSPTASASAGPSLDAKDAAERADAAREAAKKYGGSSS